MKNNKKIRLAVLFGGKSSEYEVSLQSAYALLTCADAEKYDIFPIGITKDGLWLYYTGDWEAVRLGTWCEHPEEMDRVTMDLTPAARSFLLHSTHSNEIRRLPVDVVFPMLHGAYGEDGKIQGMLACADIPFVGCESAASAVCMDKAITKALINTTGVRQADCLILRSGEQSPAEAAEAVESRLSYPVFVKPARAGSSVGVAKARNRSELEAAMQIAFQEDAKILVEETIVGREIEVAVLEENGHYTVSDCAEIDSGADFYDYEAKYISNTSRYYIPARLSESLRNEVRRQAEIIFRTLECRTLSRVDFFVQEDGGIVFNEINTLPGFTSISMYPKLMMATGLSFAQLIDRLIAAVLP